MGLVDYATADDMRNAISKLDDTEFRSTQSHDRCGGGGCVSVCSPPLRRPQLGVLCTS